MEKIELLNITEAAKVLGISVPTMRHLLLDGKIPYNKSAHKYFILKENIEKWCKKEITNEKN